MSLDALAPDQRAVVQLVLQQGRSYADLAQLLAIAEPAVRERAQRGLASLADPGDLDAEEQAEIADYLLGQGSPSAREATKSLVRADPDVNAWAQALAAQLAALPGTRLPEVPELVARRRRSASAEAATAATAPEPGVPEEAVTAGEDPTAPGVAPPEDLGTAASGVPMPDSDASDETPAVRARPRPARAVPPPAAGDEDRAPAAQRRSSRLGGVLLIVVVAALLAVGLVVFLTRGSDEEDGSAGTSATPTASAAPTAAEGENGEVPADAPAGYQDFQAAGQIELSSRAGSDAQGVAVVYQRGEGDAIQLTFAVQAQGLEPNTGSDGYAVWLTGGGDPTLLGYNAAPVGEDGALQVLGPPRGRQAQAFTRRFQRAQRIVVSRETEEGASEPADVVLSGEVPTGG